MSDTSTPDGTHRDEVVTTAHGSGGGKMRSMIDDLVLSRFDGADPEGGVGLGALDDGAVLPVEGNGQEVVVTTDSHVVSPPEFPGGDIGELAVAGTVNDLAVMGATDVRALSSARVNLLADRRGGNEDGFPGPRDGLGPRSLRDGGLYGDGRRYEGDGRR